MKYLKVLLVLVVATCTFGSAMAQHRVVHRRHIRHHHWAHRHRVIHHN